MMISVSWMGLVYGIVVFIMLVALLCLWVWPRHNNGKLYNFDEFDEFINSFPTNKKDYGRVKKVTLMIVLFIVSVGYALTNHTGKSQEDEFDI